ncbi:MAG: PEGA domain-containing protein [Bryobacteraceae bacterium]
MMIRTRLISLLGLLALLVGTLSAQTGTLKTKVAPNDAAVFVDGKYLGPAGYFASAQKYQVAAGEHELKLVDPRYEEYTGKITITAGKTTSVKEVLKKRELAKPPFGLLRVKNANPKAGVFLNNHFYGFVDEIDNTHQGLLLPPGEYELKVESPGAADFEQKVKIEADKTLLIHSSK